MQPLDEASGVLPYLSLGVSVLALRRSSMNASPCPLDATLLASHKRSGGMGVGASMGVGVSVGLRGVDSGVRGVWCRCGCQCGCVS